MSSFAPTKAPKMHECRKERKRRTYRKSNQRTHHTNTTKYPRSFHEYPRSFAKTTIAHSKFLMCIDAKFPHTQQSTPKFRNVQKSEVSDYLKRPSKFPPIQQSTPKFHNTLKSKVSDYLKQPSKFPYTHEVREFLTIPHPQGTRPNTHTAPPKHFGVSDSLQNPLPFKGKFHTLGSRPTTTHATANGR